MDIVISNSSQEPIYEQIEDQVKSQILEGKLMPGEALPSLRALARALHISVITTKRAYSDLERNGFLKSVEGKGCFVSPKNPSILREEQLRRAEAALQKAVDIAKRSGIRFEELEEMLTLLYGGKE